MGEMLKSPRRPRVSSLVATLMTALILMVASLAFAWFFHVLPHIDLLSSQHAATSGHAAGGRHPSSLTVAPSSADQKTQKDPLDDPEVAIATATDPAEKAAPASTSSPSPSPPPGTPPTKTQTSHPAHEFCPPLSKALLQQHAKRNTVLLAFATFEQFKEYGRTFYSHIQAAGISYALVAVADLRTARLVAHYHMPCFTVNDAPLVDPGLNIKYRSAAYKQLTWRKVSAVQSVHALGVDLVHSDLDVVWFRDPLEYFLDKHKQPDLMVSLDPSTTANALGDEGLEAGVNMGHYINTGLYFLRSTPGSSTLLSSWQQLASNTTYTQRWSDQEGLLMHLQGLKSSSEVDSAARVVWLFNKATSLAQLSPIMFQGGYSHTMSKLHEVHKVQPYALHMTWVYGKDHGKKHRLRELQYMDDPPEYYEEGLYLTVGMSKVEVPAGFNDMTDSNAMAEHHWRVMQQQLKDMYYAIAIAYCADRILVLPKLTCLCIHNWFETQQCRLPGDKLTKLPFTCPADYVFDMEKLSTLLITSRRVLFREHTWLENNKTAAKYKAKAFVVEAGAVGNPVHEETRHVLPSKYKDFELVGELHRLKQHPVIHVPNPEQLFGGFTHNHIQVEFNKKLGELALTWCCLPDSAVKEKGLPDGKHQLKIQP